jgi:hypothetical protein
VPGFDHAQEAFEHQVGAADELEDHSGRRSGIRGDKPKQHHAGRVPGRVAHGQLAKVAIKGENDSAFAAGLFEQSGICSPWRRLGDANTS